MPPRPKASMPCPSRGSALRLSRRAASPAGIEVFRQPARHLTDLQIAASGLRRHIKKQSTARRSTPTPRPLRGRSRLDTGKYHSIGGRFTRSIVQMPVDSTAGDIQDQLRRRADALCSGDAGSGMVSLESDTSARARSQPGEAVHERHGWARTRRSRAKGRRTR